MAEMRSTLVGDITMRWMEEGEGPAVEFVHGIPTGPDLWRHVLPRLEAGRKLAWEMVGYAGSIPGGTCRDISVACQAEYLLAWLDAIGIERAVLVGHDLGGGVAQIAAVRAPARCAGLVLVNSIAYDSWPIPALIGPITSSFPSGHMASELAFSLGAAQELPLLILPLYAATAVSEWSLVRSRSHYPSDVLAGGVLAVGVAAVMWKLWPTHRSRLEDAAADTGRDDPHPDK